MADTSYGLDVIRTDGSIAGTTGGVADMYGQMQTLQASLMAVKPDEIADSSSASVSVVDSSGNVTVPVYKCRQCGKTMDAPSSTGFCSRSCQLKYQTSLLGGKYSELKEDYEHVSARIQIAVNLSLNMIASLNSLNSMITSMLNMSLEDRTLLVMKKLSSILTVYIKQATRQVLVWKDNIILGQIDRVKSGVTLSSSNAALGSYFKTIDSIQKATDTLTASFNTAYGNAYKTVVSAMKPYLLEPESMNFGKTPRSTFLVSAAKFANKIPPCNLTDSIVDIRKLTEYETIINSKFPTIQNAEYVEDPSVFRERMLLSEYNVTAVKMMLEPLEAVLSQASDPLPKYENLKISNVQWVVFLLSGWGGMTKKHFGFPAPYLK